MFPKSIVQLKAWFDVASGITGLSNDFEFEFFSHMFNDVNHVPAGYVQILQSRVRNFTKARAYSLQHFTHSAKQLYSSQLDMDAIWAMHLPQDH